MKEPINLRLTGPQSKAYRYFKPHNTLCLAFGRGGGKSWFVRQLAYLLVATWDGKVRATKDDGTMRGVRIVFLMPTFKQFKDIHSRLMEQELTGKWAHLGAQINHQDWTITFPGGSIIQVFPASEHGSQRARGIRADAVFADEADDIDEPVYNGVVQPWFTEPWSLNVKVFSGTPKRGRHGLLFSVKRRGDLGERARRGEHVTDDTKLLEILLKTYCVHAWHIHFPEIVSQAAVAEAKATMPPAVFKREYECDFDAAEGLVYGEVFNSSFHVRLPPPDVVWSEILIGCDHGWEHPGCLLLIGVIGNGKDAVCWVLEEIYEAHQPDGFWKAKLRELYAQYPKALFYGDPSQPKTLESYRIECKARVQEVDNSVDEGIRAVADRFVIREKPNGEQYARLYVSPNCPNLIRELGLYRRKKDPKNPDGYLEAIDKRNDDACDTLRYPIFNRFGPVGPSERKYGHMETRQ